MKKNVAEMPVTWRSLVVLLIITLGLAGISAFLTRNSMDVYQELTLPPFAPPGWVFPVVWSILYPTMAVATWFYLRARPPHPLPAIALYFVQLLVNVIWPILFFVQKALGLSFVWLLLLWALALTVCLYFYRHSKLAGGLFIPYLMWLAFAAVLNFSIARMNPA